MKIKDLNFDKNNYNNGNEFGNSLIEKSLRNNGAGRSILLDKNNNIIAGNKTAENAGAVGLDDVIVVDSDGTKLIAVRRTDIDIHSKQGKELALADNATSKANITWNHEALKEDWGDDELKAWGIEEIVVEKLEAIEDNYETPETIETDIVLGDLIEIGEHRLLCGDSTDSEQVAKLMNGEKADMVFTDPPYNVDYGNSNNPRHKSRTILNDKKTDTDWDDFVKSYMSNLLAFTNGNIYISMSDKELGHMQLSFEECGGRWASFIIWVKDRLVLSGKDYHSRHETILYGWNEKVKNRLRVEDRTQDDVWEIKRPSTSDLHPTMKPIELIERMLTNSTRRGMNVLDLFLGSGSTMVASHQLKRKCYGMELDPKHCQVIVDRMKKLDSGLIVKCNGVVIH